MDAPGDYRGFLRPPFQILNNFLEVAVPAIEHTTNAYQVRIELNHPFPQCNHPSIVVVKPLLRLLIGSSHNLIIKINDIRDVAILLQDTDQEARAVRREARIAA